MILFYWSFYKLNNKKLQIGTIIMSDTNDIPENPNPFENNNIVDVNASSTINDAYWQFVDQLEASFKSMISDARAGDINKAAALRARKMSMVLRKDLQEFRELSIAHDKRRGRKNRNVDVE